MEHVVSAVPPDEVLPCGCVLRCAVVGGVNTLTIIPCRLSCVNYRNTIGLAADYDVPVKYRQAP